LGTVSFHGHGGSSVMGQWDDVTPHAYEEVWDGTNAADVRIDGRSGNNLLTYDSPSFSGLQLKMAHVQGASAAITGTTNGVDLGAYTDFGIQYTPEMVDGLTVGYAEAEMEDTSTTSIDHSTYFIKYTMGGLTAAYQDHEADGPTAAKSDESTSWAVSYAVSDNLTIAYGERDYNDNTGDDTAASNSLEQNDSGFSASYTMGGMTIAGHMNSNDNVGGASAVTADKEAYEFALSFAF